ncbi:MAG: hypothetical protein KAX55_07960, partial [Propionivibrio sp.]|nr:hypothetical protein [Propionivibrio sp.]
VAQRTCGAVRLSKTNKARRNVRKIIQEPLIVIAPRGSVLPGGFSLSALGDAILAVWLSSIELNGAANAMALSLRARTVSDGC